MSPIRTTQLHLALETDLRLDLDPKLQSVILEGRNRGIEGYSLLEPTLSVVARIKTSPVAHMTISSSVKDPASGDLIVAGEIDTAFIQEVRRDVVSLKFANPLFEAIDLRPINSTPEELTAVLHEAAPKGEGVIIGFVDGGGLDAVHSNFRNADGTTRILAMWDQNQVGAPTPQPYNYGREYLAREINIALSNCPNGVAVCPSYQLTTVNPRSHATHVADVAAGNGGLRDSGTQAAGVAPNADIVYVELHREAARPTVAGTWRHVIDGIHYIFEKANKAGQPAVVNVSLQALGGPHDDLSLIARALNGFVAVPGRAIVLAESETRESGQHAEGVVPAAGFLTLEMNLGLADSNTTDVEIWYGGENELSAVLTSDSGETLGPVALDSTATLESNGTVVGRIHHRRRDPNSGDNLIEILFGPSIAGNWRVTLTSVNALAVPFNAWITDRDAVFTSCVRTSHTTNGMNASSAISVGVFQTVSPPTGADFSGEGPDRLGGQKPDLLAPGLGVRTAAAKGSPQLPRSGTSIAAPHVTGVVALMMSAARAVGRQLTASEIKTALTSKASGGGVWNPRTGYGVVNGAASVAAVAPVRVPPID